MKSVKIVETGIDEKFWSKEELARIDVEGLKRKHLVIEWTEVNEEIKTFIRDFLMLQYSLPIKSLRCISHKYVAQKSMVVGTSDDVEAAGITIEPLNPDIAFYLSQIPINQTLPIGCQATVEEEIPYELKEDGTMHEHRFLSSDSLKFSTDIKHPCLRHVHICGIETGSKLREKFVVEWSNPAIISLTLFGFKRNDLERKFHIWVYDFWHLSIKEVIDRYIKWIEDDYTEPVIHALDSNDYGQNILNKPNLLKWLKAISREIDGKKITPIDIVDIGKV